MPRFEWAAGTLVRLVNKGRRENGIGERSEDQADDLLGDRMETLMNIPLRFHPWTYGVWTNL